jgi:hypothetical protein
MSGADNPSLVEAQLLALVEARAPAEGAAWLRDTAAAIARGQADVRVAFPSVSRRVGRGGLGAPADARLALELAGEPCAVSLAAWRIDDAARAVLLTAATRRDPAAASESMAVARDLYERGDARERTGVLRALSVLAHIGRGAASPDDGVVAVLDAVRTSQGEIFEAAICDSAFAGAFLPEHEYRKAVLKAVFIGLSIVRIARLDQRADAELTSSLLDLVTEREAASRTIAPELWPVIALHPPPGLAAKLLGYLEHPAADHRAAAAIALGRLVRAGDARLTSFLADRAGREPAPAVRDALARALA